MRLTTALAFLLSLLAGTARADYNRGVGVVGLPDPAFTVGQIFKAVDADNAEFRGGTNNTVLIGTGLSYTEASLEQCNVLSSPPEFLWFNATTRDFQCVAIAAAGSQGSAGYVQRADGSGGFVGTAALNFDPVDNSLSAGTTTLPGKIQFPLPNSDATAYAQIQGRGGGHYLRFYGDRRVALSGESFYVGLDSQANSLTDGFFITRENPDPFVGTLVFRLGEDHTLRFYSATGNGQFTALQAPPAGTTGSPTFTLPGSLPATTRYCLGSDLTGVWSFVDCALLLGRAGGQVLLGGTASAENLTLGANAASSLSGRIGTLSEIRALDFSTETSTGAGIVYAMRMTSTWDVNSSVGGTRMMEASPIMNYAVAPLLAVGPAYFYNGASIVSEASMTINGIRSFRNASLMSPATGTTLTLTPLNSLLSLNQGSFDDFPAFNRAGTGAYDASASYIGYSSHGTIATGVTIDQMDGFRVQNIGGAGTLNKRRGIVVDNQTKCTAPNCTGISNSSTTDEPGATQNLNASGAITGCTTRTSAYLTQGSASATLRINATPTLADGRDGQRCKITNVDAAGNTVISVEDETVTAGTNLRVSTAASCPLCLAGTCALNTRDYVEFTYNGVLGDWIMTDCQDN